MSNLFGAPMDHGLYSVQTGFDELGRPIYRTPLGSIVGEAIPEPPRQNALASILRTEVDPFTGRAVHYRDDLQPTRTGNALAGLLQGVTQGLTAPGRAARGQPVTLGDVWSTALDAGALAAPMPAPAGAVRMFAGRTARTADLEALARAEDMARAGAVREDIWGQTGWFQGPDGQWRFEIDDSAAQLRVAMPEYGREGTIARFIDHDDLFRAYPDVAVIPADLSPSDVRRGFYNPGSEYTRVSAPDAETASSVFLHEIQHAIQERESFSRGGLPSYFDNLSQDDAFDAYQRLAGEVEARNAEARRNMSAAERRATPPWETQDTPNALQILRQPSGGPSLSVQSPADEIARMLREGRARQYLREIGALE